MKTDKLKYAIVTCATPNWLAPAAVSLLSCHLCGLDENTELYIVSTGVTPQHRQELTFFNNKHSCNIQLLSTETAEFQNTNTGRYSIATLLRLKLDRLLSAEFQRVLYIDSDILAGSSCKELLTTELHGKSLGAVEEIGTLDWISKNGPTLKTIIGMETDKPFFNAGVILFDWQQALRLNLFAQCRTLLNTKSLWPTPDQDVLNLCSIGNWKQLHPKWNIDKKLSGYLFLNPGLRHFTGAQKPWNSPYRFGNKKYAQFYRDSLEETPWSVFMRAPANSWPIRPNLLHIMRKLSFRTRGRLLKHFDETV